MLNSNDFLRYSRHFLLKEVGIKGQKKIRKSKILIIGLGGLGSIASIYLFSSGVNTIIVADGDIVELSDLQRQIIYNLNQLGELKAKLVKNYLKLINPDSQITAVSKYLDKNNMFPFIKKVDIVLDCTDNLKSRRIINELCIKANKPLVIASAIGFKGQIIVIKPPWKFGCYSCLWSTDVVENHNCESLGIFSPITGIIGTFQALETLKLILYGKSSINGKILLFNGFNFLINQINLKKNTFCLVCGEKNENNSK
ncbi:HesA/MoeB/ThiF family protein [Buchnera aphidicola (Mindarus keteleerifoliae)]|uniref:HesA/MoeB/ThiF family protein n=1 Tax=Buchnera aphidicola TaxID=9 RepID=UPI0031B6AD8C